MPPPNQKRFRQIDNEQYNFHTDPCTVYVTILYHHTPECNLILRLPIMPTLKFINEII